MKKATFTALLVIGIILRGFSQQDSVVVKMSTEEFQRWTNYNSAVSKSNTNLLDAIIKNVMGLKDNMSRLDTSTVFIAEKAILFKSKK